MRTVAAPRISAPRRPRNRRRRARSSRCAPAPMARRFFRRGPLYSIRCPPSSLRHQTQPDAPSQPCHGLIMDQTLFDDLQATLTKSGGAPAIDELCAQLRERKEFSALFYALLMKKRFELGVSPVPTGSNQD